MKRYSMQRDMILNALRQLDHPSAPEIYERVRMTYPQISLGTVYRNLNVLAEAGEILRLTFQSASDRFDPNTHDHSHVFCTHCGRVLDVEHGLPGDLLSQLDEYVSTTTDVEVSGRELAFYGVCADCRAAAKNQEFPQTAGHSYAKSS